jgi:TolB-like protein/tetratricopeptide (TPR) repeat protein
VTLSNGASEVLRFADFELDLRTAELSSAGSKSTLPEQPFRILTLLLEHAGEVVTREALRKKLWSDDVFVDFEDSLNSAIRRLRLALRDSADNPRFLETLPRHGYRLKIPTQHVSSSPPAAEIVSGTALRLAVLPFQDFSSAGGEEYLVDSLTDAVITALAKVPKLRVISRTSVMLYKNVGKMLPEIARELRADALIEGAVLRVGDRLRITVQLVDAASDQHVWAESYERDLADKLTLEEEISQAIAHEIPHRLHQTQFPAPITPALTSEAYNCYLKGRHLVENTGRNDYALKKATVFFEEAVSESPLFAEAYAGMAEAYDMSAMFCLLPAREASLKAQRAAKYAIELDGSNAHAYAALGYALMLEWRWHEAATAFEKALELNSRDALGHRWYAEYLMAVGQSSKAVSEIERASELDRLSVITNSMVGWIYYGVRQFEQAAQQFRRTLELDENFAATFSCLGMLNALRGKFKDGIGEYQRAINLGGTVQVLRGLGFLYGIADEKAKAHEVLQETKKLAKQGWSVAYANASIYAGLGEKAQAFEWLNKACDDYCGEMMWLKWDPQLDSLRSDIRFQKLLRRIGLSA